jgi:pimeloyl-[acyl-carrier protein] methyl ester esterase
VSALSVEVRGQGPTPLVMLHGWAMHGGVFDALAERLRDRFTMYLVDLPGHGHSRASSLSLEPLLVARAVASATPPAAWLGWSLGGLVALTAALGLPERATALVMVDASPRFMRADDWPQGSDPHLVRQLASDLATDYHATLERFIALEAMGSGDPRGEARHLRELVFSRGEPDARVLMEGIALLENTDLRERLATLGVPSLWLAGRRDRVVHPAAMQAAATLCAGRFIEIPHAGHAPFIGHADVVASAITTFIDSLP